MQLKLSGKYIVVSVLLFIVMLEAHELVHINVGVDQWLSLLSANNGHTGID